MQRSVISGGSPTSASGDSNGGSLTLGEPNDMHEREADAIAAQVLSLPAGSTQIVAPSPVSVVQTKPAGATNRGANSIDSASQAGIDRARRSGGRPLASGIKGFMEPRFGADFGRVRIHDGGSAAALTRQLNARAFTVGNDIFFGTGRTSFDDTIDRLLLAHELTHTIQQTGSVPGQGGVIQRSWLDNLYDNAKEGATVLWDDVKGTTTDTWQRLKNVPCSLGIVGTPVEAWLANEEISRLASHEGKYVRKGASGEHVGLIQQVIYAWGCKKRDMNLLPVHGVDRKFGKETKGAVKEFQRGHDLSPDGIVGWQTSDALHRVVLGRIEGTGEPNEESSTDNNKTRQYYLKEGAKVINRAKFGWVAGDKPGRKDQADAYDPRFWGEVKGKFRIVRAKTTPAVAMRMLVKYIDKDLPNPSGGSGPVRWSFDCLEGSHAVSLYADWKMMGDDDFNATHTPLELGMHPASDNWGDDEALWLVQKSKGGPVFTVLGHQQMPSSMDEYVEGAYPGTLVVLRYPEAVRQCQAAGGSGMFACDLQHENTIKVNHGKFYAHPYGTLSLEEIKKQMVDEVPGPINEIFVTTLKARGQDIPDDER